MRLGNPGHVTLSIGSREHYTTEFRAGASTGCMILMQGIGFRV